MGGGPPDFRQGFSCPALLWILPRAPGFRVPGFHRLRPVFPKPFRYLIASLFAVLNPIILAYHGLASCRFARRYSGNRCFFLFLPLLRCFSSRRFPPHYYFIHNAVTELFSAGFPHSDIRGSMAVCAYPRLFAACHVLLRLLAPRHSPFALYCLSLFFSSFTLSLSSLSYSVVKVRYDLCFPS